MFCRKVEEFLATHAIPFQSRNVAEDATAMEDLMRLGVATTPVAVIDGAMVIGFDPKRLANLLGLEQ